MSTNAVSAAKPTYPGVYVEELPSSVRTISTVTTSVTAFVGHTRRGPLNQPVRVTSFAEFERRFGGLSSQSAVGYAVHQFFGNGGTVAVIVRVTKAGSGKAACATLESTEGHSECPVLEVHAKEPGHWGNGLRVAVDYDTSSPDDEFNLRVYDARGGARETFTGLSMDASHGRHAPTVINSGSRLIRVDIVGEGRPDPSGTVSKRFGQELPDLAVDLTVKIGEVEREFTLYDPQSDGEAPCNVTELALLLERKLRALPDAPASTPSRASRSPRSAGASRSWRAPPTPRTSSASSASAPTTWASKARSIRRCSRSRAARTATRRDRATSSAPRPTRAASRRCAARTTSICWCFPSWRRTRTPTTRSR